MCLPRLTPLTALVIAVLLTVANGCSREASFTELLTRANEALSKGDTNAAIIDIKSALQQEPNNAAARRLLGEIYLFRQDGTAAAAELERSLRADFDPETARLFAQTLNRIGEHERLVELYNEGFFQLTESDGELRAVLARSLASLRDIGAARETLANARTAAPGNAYVRFTAAEFQARLDGDVAGARLALKQLLSNQPELTDAWSLLATLSLAQRQYNDALAALQRVVELNPYRLGDRFRLATLQLQLGNWDAARPQIAALAAAAPDSPETSYLQTRVLLHEGKEAEALEKLTGALGTAPNHAPSLFLASVLNAQRGTYSTALNQINSYLKVDPNNSQARLLLARIYLQEDLPEEAAKITRAVLDENGANLDALYLLGTSLALQDAHDEAAEAYQRALALAPDSLEIRLRLGTELLLATEREKAIEVFAESSRSSPDDLRVRIRLAQAYLGAGRTNDALDIARGAVNDFPDSALAQSLLGQVELAKDDRRAAIDAFNRALELDASDALARNAQAALSMSEDNEGIARRLFQGFLEPQPPDLENVMEIRASDIYDRDFASLETRLLKAVDAAPDAIAPRINLARAALANDNPAGAVEALTPIRDRFDDDPRLHYLLAKAHEQRRDLDAARAATDRLLELVPDDPEALRVAAAIATAQGDGKAAESYLRKALEAIDVPGLRSALAENLFRQGRFGDATAEIGGLPDAVRASEPMQMLQGAIAVREGDLDAARSHYEAAYAATPATRNVLAIAAVDWQAQERETATTRLAGWLAENPGDALTLNQLATYQLALEKTDEARASFERLLELAPNNAIALNNLAWLYRESDTDKALAFVDRALEAAPDIAPFLDTKAMILHNAGRSTEALAVMDEALSVGGGNNPLFLLNKARILTGLGRTDEARAIVEKLPENGPPDYNRDRASLQRDLGATG